MIVFLTCMVAINTIMIIVLAGSVAKLIGKKVEIVKPVINEMKVSPTYDQIMLMQEPNLDGFENRPKVVNWDGVSAKK